MAFTGNYMCTSFKQELLQGVHNFSSTGGNTFKLALYDNNATFNATTTDYTARVSHGLRGHHALLRGFGELVDTYDDRRARHGASPHE